MEREHSIYSFWPCFMRYYNFRAFNLHEKPDLLYCQMLQEWTRHRLCSRTLLAGWNWGIFASAVVSTAIAHVSGLVSMPIIAGVPQRAQAQELETTQTQVESWHMQTCHLPPYGKDLLRPPSLPHAESPDHSLLNSQQPHPLPGDFWGGTEVDNRCSAQAGRLREVHRHERDVALWLLVVVSVVFLAQNWAGFPDPLALSS